MKFKSLFLASLACTIVVLGVAVISLLRFRRPVRAEPDVATASLTSFRPDNPVRDLSTLGPWNVPSFDYVDQDGHHVTNRNLLGHPWIADFIYTQCTTACPVLTAHSACCNAALQTLRSDSFRFRSIRPTIRHQC